MKSQRVAPARGLVHRRLLYSDGGRAQRTLCGRRLSATWAVLVGPHARRTPCIGCEALSPDKHKAALR